MDVKERAIKVGRSLISESMKSGKDSTVQFQEFLDWLINLFSLENLLKHNCNYEMLFDSVKEDATFYHCMKNWIEAVNKELGEHRCLDFFGEIYEIMFQSSAKAQRNQQYFTPEYIFDFIARIQQGQNNETIKFCNEPSCGSGRGLLKIWQEANWKDKYIFYAEDIDTVSVKMCALNMMINGMVGYVICHNTLFPDDFIMGLAVNEVRYPFPSNYYSIRKMTKAEFMPLEKNKANQIPSNLFEYEL